MLWNAIKRLLDIQWEEPGCETHPEPPEKPTREEQVKDLARQIVDHLGQGRFTARQAGQALGKEIHATWLRDMIKQHLIVRVGTARVNAEDPRRSYNAAVYIPLRGWQDEELNKENQDG